MDEQTNARLASLEAKIDQIAKSVESTHKIFVWTMWITVAVIVLPLIASAFLLPKFMSTIDLTGQLNSLQNLPSIK